MRLLTAGEIARRLGVPLHRVKYVVDTRRLVPESWAGRHKVFSEAQCERIRAELARIERERMAGGFHD